MLSRFRPAPLRAGRPSDAAERHLVLRLQQSFANIATGRADHTKDADWQSYVDQFTTIGVDSLLAIHQENYDAQY